MKYLERFLEVLGYLLIGFGVIWFIWFLLTMRPSS